MDSALTNQGPENSYIGFVMTVLMIQTVSVTDLQYLTNVSREDV